MAKKPAKVVLLSGGNPQIAKAEGAGAVRKYIAAMPAWKREVGRRIDRLVGKTVPGVRKAVKWNSPFYGVEGRGFFLSYHCCTSYVKIAFFHGAELDPMPPVASKQKHVRYFHVHEDTTLDEELVVEWIRQAAALPGWEP